MASVAQKRTGKSAARGSERGTRAEALEIIFATATEDKEGFRHGALGAPRMGKTYHLKEVVTEGLDRGLCELALIHDCKRLDVQYEGNVRADLADLAAKPLGPDDEPIVIFHGDPARDIMCSVEDVAAYGLRNGRAGGSTLVLIDELYQGMKARQTWEGPSFARILREGSSQRVSSAWTTQIPQSLPTEALDLTETVALFHLQRRSLRYAAQMMDLEPEAVDVIARLERGEFILITADGWDGKVYGPT